jgi:hypothetical protein
MNCFNIREVESLLKGKFFPDLVNTHDHKTLLNNSIINLRFKINGLDTIDNNTLLFYQYGLYNTNSKRYNTYINPKTITLNNYEFYRLSSFTDWTFTQIQLLTSKSPNILIYFLVDMYTSILVYFSLNKELSYVDMRGFFTVFDVLSSSLIYIKSEVERQFLHLTFTLDFNKELGIISRSISTFKLNLLDKFLYGYMENNIGIYKELVKNFPEKGYTDVDTNHGFISFFFTLMQHFLSRSVLLYLEVI